MRPEITDGVRLLHLSCHKLNRPESCWDTMSIKSDVFTNKPVRCVVHEMSSAFCAEHEHENRMMRQLDQKNRTQQDCPFIEQRVMHTNYFSWLYIHRFYVYHTTHNKRQLSRWPRKRNSYPSYWEPTTACVIQRNSEKSPSVASEMPWYL